VEFADKWFEIPGCCSDHLVPPSQIRMWGLEINVGDGGNG
jgi:hypothetical protein